MTVHLDLADIQGNILTAYGKQGFPKGRFITLHVDEPDRTRRTAAREQEGRAERGQREDEYLMFHSCKLSTSLMRSLVRS